jgi:hypothetical protein
VLQVLELQLDGFSAAFLLLTFLILRHPAASSTRASERPTDYL